MKMKFCLPVIKTSKRDAIEMIKDNINDFDIFEIWLDHIRDLDNQFIIAVISLLKDRLIIVLRRNDMSDTVMDFKKRCDVIERLSGQSAMLDLDITSQKKELLFVLQNKINVSLVISYHDFRKTDSDKKLMAIINLMEKFKPKIYKIAAFCQNENDTVRLLSLLLKLKSSGKKCIVLGMGKDGIATRIFGSLWGSELVYAPKVSDERSASGQLTKERLEKLFNLLEVNYGR